MEPVFAPQEYGADLQGRAPLVLQDVQAYPAQLVDVWVVDFCQESHLPHTGRHFG